MDGHVEFALEKNWGNAIGNYWSAVEWGTLEEMRKEKLNRERYLIKSETIVE